MTPKVAKALAVWRALPLHERTDAMFRRIGRDAEIKSYAEVCDYLEGICRGTKPQTDSEN